MPSKLVQFIKQNKTRIDLAKSGSLLILGIAMLVLLIVLAVTLANGTRELIHIASTGIDTLQETLSSANDGLNNVSSSFDTLKDSLQTVKDYVYGIEPILENMTDLVGSDLVKIAHDGQNSLKAAAQGSKLVDDALTLLSRLPLLNFDYAPEKALNESLLELSETFGSIPESLSGLEKEISNSAANISTFDTNFIDFNANIDNLKTNVDETGSSLEGFIDQLQSYQQKLPKVQRTIITWIAVITCALCLLLLIWMVNQFFTFIMALEAIKSDKIAMLKRPEA
jgi:predicted PurR-regulated permease PerM